MNIREYLYTPIHDFFNAAKSNAAEGFMCNTRSVTFVGGLVFSYQTCIASIGDGKLFINKEKYSTTTSHLQNALRYLAPKYGFEIVEVESNDRHLRFNIGAIAA